MTTAFLLSVMSPVYAQMVEDNGNSTLEQQPKVVPLLPPTVDGAPNIDATNPAPPVQHTVEELFAKQTLPEGEPTFILNATRVSTCMTAWENLSRLDLATAITLQLDNNKDSEKYLAKAKLEDQMADAALDYGVANLLNYAIAHKLPFTDAARIGSILSQASGTSSRTVLNTMVQLLSNDDTEELTPFVQKNHDLGALCQTFMNTYAGDKGFVVPKPDAPK